MEENNPHEIPKYPVYDSGKYLNKGAIFWSSKGAVQEVSETDYWTPHCDGVSQLLYPISLTRLNHCSKCNLHPGCVGSSH